MALRDDSSTRVGRLPVAIATLVTAAYAALATTTHPRTWQASLAVTLPALIVLLMAVRRPSTPVTQPGTLNGGWILWGTVLLAGLLWEAWAFVHQPSWTVGSEDYPTLSVLLEPFLEDPIVRFGAWCLWLAIGWRLVRR